MNELHWMSTLGIFLLCIQVDFPCFRRYLVVRFSVFSSDLRLCRKIISFFFVHLWCFMKNLLFFQQSLILFRKKQLSFISIDWPRRNDFPSFQSIFNCLECFIYFRRAPMIYEKRLSFFSVDLQSFTKKDCPSFPSISDSSRRNGLPSFQ